MVDIIPLSIKHGMLLHYINPNSKVCCVHNQ